MKQKYGEFECCCYRDVCVPYCQIPPAYHAALANGERDPISVVQHPEHVLRSMRQLEQPHKEQPIPSEAVEFKHSVRDTILARSPVHSEVGLASPFGDPAEEAGGGGAGGGSGGPVLLR